MAGCINPAYIISRFRGFDIRNEGTGNAGATNVLVVMGRMTGIMVMLLDIAKTVIAVNIAVFLFPEIPYLDVWTGNMVVIGHAFPVNMKFHGGKGVACLGGLIIVFWKELFIPLVLVGLIVAVVIDYGFAISITAAVLFPVLVGLKMHSFSYFLILCVPTILIIYKHKVNFERIRKGEEIRLSSRRNKAEN